MRLDIYLRADNSAATIQFYVHELGFFVVAADYGMDSYLLRGVDNNQNCIHITSWASLPDRLPRFSLRVPNANKEFKRLSELKFESGGDLVRDEFGQAAVFEWPGGKNFMVKDPTGNCFLLMEDYIAGT